MKELSLLTFNANKATPELLRKALTNLGHTVTIEEIRGCLNSDEPFDIFAFIRSMKRSAN
jgi:hypothetical protein